MATKYFKLLQIILQVVLLAHTGKTVKLQINDKLQTQNYKKKRRLIGKEKNN